MNLLRRFALNQDPDQKAFDIKFKGIIKALGNAITRYHSHSDPKMILKLLIDNKDDLGASWGNLFLEKFDYRGKKRNFDDPVDDLFGHCVKITTDPSELLLFIVENAPIEFAYNSRKLDKLALVRAANHYEEIAVAILKRLDPARKDQDLPMYRAALENAQKNNFRDLIAAIEERIDYQPPAAVTQMKQKFAADIALPDPHDAIENTIRSGSLSEALRIDDQTLMACTRFFERFQNLYAQTLSHADDANAAREVLDQRIARLQSSLKTLMDEMDPNTRYESIGQELWIATRNVIPWLNPRRALENSNIEVTSSINIALEQSYQLIDDCQSFAEAAPKVLDELQKLKTSYAEALTKIDDELKGDMPDDQRKLKSQLRSIFAKAHDRIGIMSGTLAIQDLANPALIETELEFVSGLKDLMVSFSASATTAINSMALIKMGMTDDMRERIYNSLVKQWDQAEKTMRLLRQHGEVEIPQIGHQPHNGVPLPQTTNQASLLARVA